MNICKIYIKTEFRQHSHFDFSMGVPDMNQRFGECQLHTFNCIWTKYGILVPQNNKTPRPFSHLMILADFPATFWLNCTFRQHQCQQMLTKMFSSKRTHQTEQKTFLQFFHSYHTFLAILIFSFFGLIGHFKSVTFICES